MKSMNLKSFSVLSVCFVLTIMILGLTLLSCELGAGRAPSVRIVFQAGEGEGIAPEPIVKFPDQYFPLPDKEKMTHSGGKVLHGWKDPTGLTWNIYAWYATTENVTLTAQWRNPNSTSDLYTVNFETGEGGGVSPASMQVVSQNMLSLPPQGRMTAPSGKVFDGWTSGSSHYAEYASYRVNANVTFTAQWKVRGSSTPNTPSTPSTPSTPTTTYTVTYDINSGNGMAPSAQTVYAGLSVTLPSGDGLSRSGYTFGGWNTNASGTGTNYSAGSSYTVTGNATLYAKWVSNNTPTYTVTFSINGGSGTAPSAQTANAGSSITLPSGDGLSRSGYTFGGWNTNATGTGTNYSTGSSYTVTGNATLYAKWDSTTSNPTTPGATYYTVIFRLNGGSGPTPNSQSVIAGESITLPSGNGLSRSGYTFGGWNTESSGTGTNYAAGSSYTPTGNPILYAKWDSNTPGNPTTPNVTTYTVTFDANGGSGTPPSPQTANSGSNITLPDGSGLSRSGYTFGGWITSSSSGTYYPVGSSFTVNMRTTLYAWWISNNTSTYTITFDANRGSGTPPPAQTVQAGSSITLPSGSGLSRDGYTFGGWLASDALIYPAGSSYTPTGNITLYARWITPDGTYTVTFDANGGSGTPPPSANGKRRFNHYASRRGQSVKKRLRFCRVDRFS